MKKFYQLLTLITSLLLFPLLVDAQRNCGAMEHLHEHQIQNPALMQRMQDIEDQTQRYIKQAAADYRNTIQIPVVVHVLYKTTSQNISDAQIQSQIDVLNEDFNRTNADANGFWAQAASMDIEFCLASIDPDGNPTDGITRKRTNKKSWRTNDDVKKASRGGVNPWPTDQYLNIWVCNLSNSILGYAQFPGDNPATDGVVVLYNAFGRVGTLSGSFDLGRTTTHEVGHWLNLRHIWGDGNCGADDFVSDTPLSDAPNYGCATGHQSCSSRDMVENYMDYSDDACMNLFTQGQIDRMSALFAAGGARESLLSSNGCGNGGNPPTASCTDGIQNGDETGVDCGGSCDACDNPPTASCTDGIQNGDETGVDCGGSCPNSCNTGGGSCDTPSNLSSSPKQGGKRALLRWDEIASADNYLVYVKVAGASDWDLTTSTTSTSLNISGLVRNQNYEWQVKALCGTDMSDWASATFTAGQSGRLAYKETKIQIYPNPIGDNFVNIDLTTYINQDVTVTIYNHLGQEQLLQTFYIDYPQHVQMDVSGLNNGIYTISLKSPKKKLKAQKVVISRLY